MITIIIGFDVGDKTNLTRSYSFVPNGNLLSVIPSNLVKGATALSPLAVNLQISTRNVYWPIPNIRLATMREFYSRNNIYRRKYPDLQLYIHCCCTSVVYGWGRGRGGGGEGGGRAKTFCHMPVCVYTVLSHITSNLCFIFSLMKDTAKRPNYEKLQVSK